MTNQNPFAGAGSLFDLLGGIGDFAGRNVPGYTPYTSYTGPASEKPKEGTKYVRADQLTLGMTVVKPDGSTSVIDNLGRVGDEDNSIEIVLSNAYSYEVWPNTMLEVQ